MRLACLYPKSVEKLCVVDIAPKDYRAHTVEIRAMNSFDPREITARKEADERLARAGVDDLAMRQFLLTHLVRTDTGLRWQVNLEGLTRYVEDLALSPLEESDRFDGETLFLLGGKSSYVQEDDRPGIVEHFPGARFEVLVSSGHNPHYESREEFVEIVEKFILGGSIADR